jgi:alpha-glucosidase
MTEWDAPAIREVISESLRAFPAVGAPATWVLSNHDVVRHASRLALTAENPQGHGIGPDSPGKPIPSGPAPRPRRDDRHARAARLRLPLPGRGARPARGHRAAGEVRQDPTWFRTDGERYGRDGCRVPIPWTADAPAYGFNDTGASGCRSPPNGPLSPAMCRRATPTRRCGSTARCSRRAAPRGSAPALEWLDGYGDDVIAFRNGNVTVIANASDAPVPLPSGTVLVASEPFDGGALPVDVAVWMLAD